MVKVKASSLYFPLNISAHGQNNENSGMDVEIDCIILIGLLMLTSVSLISFLLLLGL